MGMEFRLLRREPELFTTGSSSSRTKSQGF